MEKSICKIKIYDKKKKKHIYATGFLCKIPYPDEFTLLPVLVTNNHVINEEKFKDNKEIEIFFDEGNISKKLITYSKRKFYTSVKYDITIIEIFDKIDDLNYFLDVNDDENILKDKNLNVYILHYHLDKKESLVSHGILNIIDNVEIQHTCSTEDGSSGAPIILFNTLKVIGIHKGAIIEEKINLGTILKYPILEFNNDKKKEIKKNREIKIKGSINEINKDINIISEKKNIKKIKNIKETKDINNEIIIKIKIDKDDLNEKIFILNGIGFNDTFFDFNGLEELNELNTLMYIDNKKVEYKKYKKFEKIGIYEIKLIIKTNITNAQYMFRYCKNIIFINLSKFNTKNITNMESMFEGCRNLKSLDLSSFDTRNVKNMNMMFAASGLETLDLSSFDTKNVTAMDEMFVLCKKLENLQFSSLFDTKNVTNMNAMFGACINLKSLDLSSFNTENVIEMNEMFGGCKNLESLDLSSFRTKNVTGMNAMFFGCQKLKSLDLSKFNTKNVTDIKGMFAYCKNLKNLYFDISTLVLKKDIKMEGLFYKCKNINFSKYDINNIFNEEVTASDYLDVIFNEIYIKH